MRNIIALAIVAGAAYALAGCASTTPSQWAADVKAVQAAVPVAELAIAATSYGTLPAVQTAETQLNGDVAALTGTASPTTAAAVLSDTTILIAALPAGTLSPQHQAEVSSALALAKLLVASAP